MKRIKERFWKLNGDPESITLKGALVLVGGFIACVLICAGIINLFV